MICCLCQNFDKQIGRTDNEDVAMCYIEFILAGFLHVQLQNHLSSSQVWSASCHWIHSLCLDFFVCFRFILLMFPLWMTNHPSGLTLLVGSSECANIVF